MKHKHLFRRAYQWFHRYCSDRTVPAAERMLVAGIATALTALAAIIAGFMAIGMLFMTLKAAIDGEFWTAACAFVGIFVCAGISVAMGLIALICFDELEEIEV